MQVLVQIPPMVQALWSSQGFYRRRYVTLTFEPVTFPMPSVSREPGNEYIVISFIKIPLFIQGIIKVKRKSSQTHTENPTA